MLKKLKNLFKPKNRTSGIDVYKLMKEQDKENDRILKLLMGGKK